MADSLYYLPDMSYFCLLWVPFFYLFWRAVTGNNSQAAGIWALLSGSVIAMTQFFLGNLTEGEGFGLSRWLSGCIDIVALPVLLPLFIYLLLVCFRIVSGNVDFAGFALLWLIPCGAIRALSWSSIGDPILLVLVPVLWTAIAVGMSFFIDIIRKGLRLVIFPAFIAMLIVPFAAACSYWAFYAQKSTFGIIGLCVAVVPMLISVILSFRVARR